MLRGGGAWLTATHDGLATRLTRISHRTPTRLLPLTDTACRLGAAHCAIGGYGGGLLGGDTVHLDVRVDPGASLCLTTQASTKVYCTKRDARVTRQTMTASVGHGGLLVLAPDPVVPYANAAYDQRQTFELAPGSSLVAVDWVGAGRVSRGERWAFTSFSSRNTVHRLDMAGAARSAAQHRGSGDPAPEPPSSPAVVIDAVRLLGGHDGPERLGFEFNRKSFNAAVTVLCTGSAAAGVCRRLRLVSAALAARRVGGRPGVLKENMDGLQENMDGRPEHAAGRGGRGGSDAGESALAEATMRTLLGDAILGVGTASDGEVIGWNGRSGASGVSHGDNLKAPDLGQGATVSSTGAPDLGSGVDAEVTVARLVAEHADDVFRLLHFCLHPLTPALGIAPYSGRIHAVKSAAAPRALEVVGARLATAEPAGEGREREVTVSAPRDGDRQSALGASALPVASVSDPLTLPSRALLPVEVSDPAPGGPALTPAQRVRLIQLCDATLPTGGFAHSAGLEAAVQLGILGAEDEEDLRRFTAAAAAGASGMLAPYAAAACAVFQTREGVEAHAVAPGWSSAQPGGVAGGDVAGGAVWDGGGAAGGGVVGGGMAGGGAAGVSVAESTRQLRAWAALDAQLHAQLASNQPGYRASVEQGRALVRVGGAWLRRAAADRRVCASLLAHGRPHGATTLGALCAMLGLPPEAAAEAVAYTTTRDVLSAAVRLNLIGPLAAVGMQAEVTETALAFARAAAARGVAHAASAAPLIEALHPCHDLLDRRIFRT